MIYFIKYFRDKVDLETLPLESQELELDSKLQEENDKNDPFNLLPKLNPIQNNQEEKIKREQEEFLKLSRKDHPINLSYLLPNTTFSNSEFSVFTMNENLSNFSLFFQITEFDLQRYASFPCSLETTQDDKKTSDDLHRKPGCQVGGNL